MRAILWALPMLLALTGCQPKSDSVYVDHSWVRLAAIPDQPAAAYFRLTGGPTDDALIAVHADPVIKTELHESMVGMEGMTGMKPLTTVPVPARAIVMFAPAGNHVMMFGVEPKVKASSTMKLTFVFKSGLQLVDNATVIAAGDEAPQF